MGEIADQIVESFFYGCGGKRRRRPRTFQSGAGERAWRCAGGEVVLMKDMSTTHLRNALGVAVRSGNPGKAKDLRRELIERGEHVDA